MRLTDISTKVPVRRPIFPLVAVLVTGAILTYGTVDMPPFGDPNNPIHLHVAPKYLLESEHEIGIPNVVTSVLASYRGFDTFGEITVVFTAAVGVMILLSAMRRKDRYGEERWGEEDVPDLSGSFVTFFWLGRDGQMKSGRRDASRPDPGEGGGS